MSRKPRKTVKPKSPAEILADKIARRTADLLAVGMAQDAATLPNHDDVEVTRAGEARMDGKKVDSDMARRLDAFEALRPSMTRRDFAGAYDAARRFERDVRMSLDQHDRGRGLDRVDEEPPKGDRTDAIVAATLRMKKARDALPYRDAWLLWDLIVPGPAAEEWRTTVARITGETNWNAQGATVRAACVNLRDVYQRQDVAGRKAA